MDIRAIYIAHIMMMVCKVHAHSGSTQDEVADVQGAATMQMHAVGAQIYECKKSDDESLQWTFREPVAALMAEGRSVGVHYAGPTWRMNDGSSIKGAVVRQAPGTTPLDISWLQLKTIEHSGEGMLADVIGVRRIKTKGGEFSGPCSPEGSFASVPYEADYVFVRPRSRGAL